MVFGNIRDLKDYGYLEEDVLKCFEYAENHDLLPLEGEKNSHVVLKEGDFLLCYPKDAHRTAVQVEKPVKIKKAIFKIKIQK